MLMTAERDTSKDKPPVGILCPQCGCRHMLAIQSNPKPKQTKLRYRECRQCGKRILTKETVVTDNVKVRDDDEFTT